MTNMTPFDWAMRPMQRYAQFSGRASRAEYWWFYLATIIIGLIAGVIDGIMGNTEVGWFGGIINLALLVPTISVTVRRLHDTDRSGLWLLIGLIAMVVLLAVAFTLGASENLGFSAMMVVAIIFIMIVAITLFVFMVLPGTDGPNGYGPDPYGPDHLEEIFA